MYIICIYVYMHACTRRYNPLPLALQGPRARKYSLCSLGRRRYIYIYYMYTCMYA